MDSFVQRMIHRFQDQVLQKMSPDRRERKVGAMRALVRSRLRSNKENEIPTMNNNSLVPIKQAYFAHSTPLKPRQVTDLDAIETPSSPDSAMNETAIFLDNDTTILRESPFVRSRYQAKRSFRKSGSQLGRSQQPVKVSPSAEREVEVPEADTSEGVVVTEAYTMYSSREFLQTALGDELYQSLDEVKSCCETDENEVSLPPQDDPALLNVSTTNLLEEIEADLPSSCSLVSKLDHTYHTVSGYRTLARLSRMDLDDVDVRYVFSQSPQPASLQPTTSDYGGTSTASNVERLEIEAMVQKALTEQAEKAVKCSKRSRLMGVEYLESEKALLLASLRYDITINELKRLRVKSNATEEDHGQLTISDVFFTMDLSLGSELGYFVCVAIEKDKLLASHLQSQIIGGQLHFDEPFRFQNLGQDFVISLQLYRLNWKESKKKLKHAVMKFMRSLSPARNSHLYLKKVSHNFSCLGCIELKIQHVNSAQLGKVVVLYSMKPQFPLGGDTTTLYMRTGVDIKRKQCGFLNAYKETCWFRRWYCQSGYVLEAWHYPEDQEDGKAPIESTSLLNCGDLSKTAGIEICARPHSFTLTPSPGSKYMLFAANSHRDMMDWIEHLNLVVTQIQIWKPYAY